MLNRVSSRGRSLPLALISWPTEWAWATCVRRSGCGTQLNTRCYGRGLSACRDESTRTLGDPQKRSPRSPPRKFVLASGRRCLLESAKGSCQRFQTCSGLVGVSTRAMCEFDASERMTNHLAGTDFAASLGNLSRGRYPGGHYLPAVVPVPNKCLFVLCARNRSRSRVSGCASLDQQLNRHDDTSTSVPTEGLLHWSLAWLRFRPKSLGQRDECGFGSTVLLPRTTCGCTSTPASRSTSAAVPKLNSHLTLRGRLGVRVPPSRIVALMAASRHSSKYVAPAPKFQPQGHPSILHFHVLVNSPTGGNISREIINSLKTSMGLEESLPETWSAR